MSVSPPHGVESFQGLRFLICLSLWWAVNTVFTCSPLSRVGDGSSQIHRWKGEWCQVREGMDPRTHGLALLRSRQPAERACVLDSVSSSGVGVPRVRPIIQGMSVKDPSKIGPTEKQLIKLSFYVARTIIKGKKRIWLLGPSTWWSLYIIQGLSTLWTKQMLKQTEKHLQEAKSISPDESQSTSGCILGISEAAFLWFACCL